MSLRAEYVREGRIFSRWVMAFSEIGSHENGYLHLGVGGWGVSLTLPGWWCWCCTSKLPT